jgi:fatty acid elongase 3
MKYVTALHSLSLCIASLGMFLMGFIGAYEIYNQNGDIGDVFLFQKEDTPRKGMMYYSLYIYYLSKFPELLDTVILVLKKKKVIFLHW